MALTIVAIACRAHGDTLFGVTGAVQTFTAPLSGW